jgi:hypothetical protein
MPGPFFALPNRASAPRACIYCECPGRHSRGPIFNVWFQAPFGHQFMARLRRLIKPAPLDYGIWVLSGFSGEWTSDGAPERGFQRIKIFKGGLGDGKVTREFECGGFDCLIFKALYNELYEGPERFGGFSGGGLWQLLGREVDGKLQITQRLLAGVAFYESELKKEGENVTREITCHGRRSVYKALVDHVQSSLHV